MLNIKILSPNYSDPVNGDGFSLTLFADYDKLNYLERGTSLNHVQL